MHESVSVAAAAHVAEIERRMQWRALPVLLFLGLMIGLATTAVLSVTVAPRSVTGLPDDRDLAAARALVGDGRLGLPIGALRFRSSLLGEPEERAAAADEAERLVRARGLVDAAGARHPRDGRIAAARADLALASGDLEHAERGYRAALESGGHHPEARLGLGVTLATRAARARDPLLARGLELEAIAQFAAVRESDAVYGLALYDRALLLDHVGRRGEAVARGREYLAREPSGPWSQVLSEALALRP